MCNATLLLLVAFVVAPSIGHAQGATTLQFSAGPTLTGTGFGIAGTAKFTPMFSASAEVNAVPFTPSLDLGDIEGVDYNADFSIWSLSLMGHVHPFGGGFALGAGLFLGGYGLDAIGIPQSTVDIGSDTYSAAELGTANASFSLGGPSPVIELGRRGGGFNVGIGVVIPANARADVVFEGPVADDPEFQAQLEQELQEIEDEIEIIPLLPFFRIGYQFGL